MGRSLEFDYAAALDRAMRRFWRSGYAATSLRELLKAMRIGEGSFYNSLGSKKQAFLESLKCYSATVGRERIAAFENAPTAARGVRALFEACLDCLDDPKAPSRLCLMAGSMTYEVLEEPDLRAYIAQEFAAFNARLIERMMQDKAVGMLPQSFDPHIVAPVVMT